MRDAFPGYYPPTEEEMVEIWEEGLVVLDTNALFNLFRYTRRTRESFLEVLRVRREDLWLPYQVGLEFQRGRMGVIRDQQDAFTTLLDKSRSALATVTKEIGALRNHPTLDLDDLRTTVAQAVQSIEQKITATQAAYDNDVVAKGQHDETTDEITELFDGHVGAPYAPDRLQEIFTLGSSRYEAKVPPGYKDAAKPEPERYGDLVLWHQILDKAAADAKSVLFVSDDQKEDWWRDFKGAKIGPRVELIDEFMERVGKRVHFMTPQQLMAYAKDRVRSITPDALREVGDVSDAQAAHDRLLSSLQTAIPEDEAAMRARGDVSDDDLVARGALEQLDALRAAEERRLRRVLEAIRREEALDGTSSEGYEKLQEELGYRRRKVAAMSQVIKGLEFKFLERDRYSNERQALIDRARVLLKDSPVPVPGTGSDWSEVSDEEIDELLASRETRPEVDALIRLAEFEIAHGYRSSDPRRASQEKSGRTNTPR